MSTVQETFDNWAQTGHGERMAKGHWPASSQILAQLKLRAKNQFLDIGCGNGYLVARAAEKTKANGKAIGLDVSPEMVVLAKRTYPAPYIQFQVGDVSRLDFPDNTFDAITAIESIYYWPDIPQGLKEVYRVLKPGGKFCAMVDFYKENPYCAVWAELMPVAMTFLSETDYQTLFEAAQLTSIRTERLLNPLPLNPAEFKPGWGYETPEDVADFRMNVGSLAVWGHKPA